MSNTMQDEQHSDWGSVPEPSLIDKAHSLVKAVVSDIPVPGTNTLIELFGNFIQPPLEKRRQEWLESLVAKVQELTQANASFNAENAFENETFVTTFLHASQVAMRSHQKEKLDALRNAVLNAALPGAPDDDLQLIFLHFVDDFTPWHLRLLQYFVDPREYGKQHDISYSAKIYTAKDAVEETFPELAGRSDFYQQLVNDLHSRGLLSTNLLYRPHEISRWEEYKGEFGSCTTLLGEQFLAFITSPRA